MYVELHQGLVGAREDRAQWRVRNERSNIDNETLLASIVQKSRFGFSSPHENDQSMRKCSLTSIHLPNGRRSVI